MQCVNGERERALLECPQKLCEKRRAHTAAQGTRREKGRAFDVSAPEPRAGTALRFKGDASPFGKSSNVSRKGHSTALEERSSNRFLKRIRLITCPGKIERTTSVYFQERLAVAAFSHALICFAGLYECNEKTTQLTTKKRDRKMLNTPTTAHNTIEFNR